MDRANDVVSRKSRDGSFVYAGVLDLPFIFDLVLDGSSAGSFSDAYLTRKGYTKILFLLVTSLHVFRWIFKSKRRELLLFVKHDVPIGFIQIESSIKPDGDLYCYVMTCAISPQFRGNRYGREMLSLLMARCGAGAEICAVCTKYARAMRRTLMGLHFVRKSVGLGLDAYTFITPAAEAATQAASADLMLIR